MEKSENICGGRIDYENPIPSDLSEEEARMHAEATKGIEDALAILAEMQDERTDKNGNVTEPITPALVGTVKEMINLHLTPGCEVLRAQHRTYEFNTGSNLDLETSQEDSEDQK